MHLPKRFIISPPFGNYISKPWATSVLGSFTLHRRSGLIRQAFKTIRPIPDGWVNRMGLRNPGLENIWSWDETKIYSVAAAGNQEQWPMLLEAIPKGMMVELNLSCPNLDYKEVMYDFSPYTEKFLLIAKLPPNGTTMDMLHRCYSMGIRFFHLCNTLPTDRGGESGKRLREYSIEAIKKARDAYGNDINIIGGGGIYTPDDLQRYKEAGATYFSLATIWFTPWKVKPIIGSVNTLSNEITDDEVSPAFRRST